VCVCVCVCVCVTDQDAPMISCPHEEYSVAVGDRALISCSVSANPGSLLTWMSSLGDKLLQHITDPTINVSIKVCINKLLYVYSAHFICYCRFRGLCLANFTGALKPKNVIIKMSTITFIIVVRKYRHKFWTSVCHCNYKYNRVKSPLLIWFGITSQENNKMFMVNISLEWPFVRHRRCKAACKRFILENSRISYICDFSLSRDFCGQFCIVSSCRVLLRRQSS